MCRFGCVDWWVSCIFHCICCCVYHTKDLHPISIVLSYNSIYIVFFYPKSAALSFPIIMRSIMMQQTFCAYHVCFYLYDPSILYPIYPHTAKSYWIYSSIRSHVSNDDRCVLSLLFYQYCSVESCSRSNIKNHSKIWGGSVWYRCIATPSRV